VKRFVAVKTQPRVLATTVVRSMPEQAHLDEIRVIFISSDSALVVPPDMIHYGMTKTAQLSISRGLAGLTKGTRVTVNSVLIDPLGWDRGFPEGRQFES
jgi:NAD(P)-dependent dehydrogenase (short-subunit alcohol dehydrogenase family)